MKREFQTQEGTVLQLRPVSNAMLARLQIEWHKRKPQPPVVDTEVNGRIVHEKNYNDPEYIEAVNLWRTEMGLATSQYFVARGVTNDPDEEFVTFHKEMFPEITKDELRFYWVTAIVPMDSDEFMRLTATITGQTMPTEEGIKHVAESFRGEN